MAFPVHRLLLCKPDCCREPLHAVQGAVYLGHGWSAPPSRKCVKEAVTVRLIVGFSDGVMNTVGTETRELGKIHSGEAGQNTRPPARRHGHGPSSVMHPQHNQATSDWGDVLDRLQRAGWLAGVPVWSESGGYH